MVGSKIAERFSGSVVELFLDFKDLFIGHFFHVDGTWKILTNKSIEIFHFSFLPGAVRIAKIRFDTILILELGVFCVLCAVVEGNGYDFLGATLSPGAMLTTRVVLPSQVSPQPQSLPLIGVQKLVDGFVADHGLVVNEFEDPCNLFR